MNNETKIPVRVVIQPTAQFSKFGRPYVAHIDGTVVDQHYCTDDEFAKGDLGFYQPNECYESSAHFSKDRRKKYAQLTDNNFMVIFLDEIFIPMTNPQERGEK